MVWLGALDRVTRSFVCCGAAAGCLLPRAAQAEATATPSAVDSESQDECLKAHENAQLLRLDSKLVQAKRALAACAVQACPSAVRDDCTEWMSQVVTATPSVVLAASSERGDETQVRVLMDGSELTRRIEGRAIELDPGAHVFRFELSPYAAVEQKVVLREGERGRVVTVRFARERPEPHALLPPAPGANVASAPAHRPVPWITYALGGASLAAIGSATAFGLIALNERSDKLDSCAPLCDGRETRDVERPALAADISVAVALISGGAALYTYWTRPEVALGRWLAKEPRLSCSLGAHASFLRYRGDF